MFPSKDQTRRAREALAGLPIGWDKSRRLAHPNDLTRSIPRSTQAPEPDSSLCLGCQSKIRGCEICCFPACV